MAESAQVQNLTVRHQAIMDLMIQNPMMKLGEIAQHFKMTQAWMSCVIHSDIFQAMLAEKMGVVFNETVLPIKEKLAVVANIALDKMINTLPAETDLRVLNTVAESTLDRLGFGAPKAPAVQINNTENNVQVNVLRSELEEARKLLGKAERPAIEVITDGVALPISLPSETSMGSGNSRESTAFPALEGNRQSSSQGSEA